MRVNFDMANTPAYQGAGQLLPSGDYTVEIVGEREQQMSGGKGTRLTFELAVLDGANKGARIFDSLNLGHIDQQTRALAQSRLRAIADAVGRPTIMDTQELFRKPFVVRLSVREYNGRQYNNVDDYKSAQSMVAAPPVAVPQSQTAAPFWGGGSGQ